eukprot:scaffold55_cov184-Skeletonema_marinoi.AAC.4
MANALMQARPNCRRKWILGWVRCRSGRRSSDGRVWMKAMMSLSSQVGEYHADAERSFGGIRGTSSRPGVNWG